MKVVSLSANCYYKNNRYNSLKNNKVIHKTASDTVSFKSQYATNALFQDFAELRAFADTNLKPFMDDSKKRYFEIGKLGLEYQTKFEKIKKRENEYFHYRFSLRDKGTSDYLKNVKPVMDKYEKFEWLNKRSSLKGNSNELLKNDNLMKKLKTFYDSYSTVQDDLDKAVSSVYKAELSNTRDGIFSVGESKKVLHDNLTTLIYYIATTPYNDSVNFYKKLSESEQMIKSPGYGLLENFENLGKLQQKAIKISSDTKIYYKNKSEIDKCLSENNKIKNNIPSLKIIDSVYDRIFKKSDRMVNETTTELSEYFKDLFGTDSTDKLLNLLDKQISEIENV